MTATTRASHVGGVATLGVAPVLVAVALYVTELSKAVAVTILTVALCVFGAAAYGRNRGRWPPRRWLVTFGVLVVAAVAFGLGLLIYGKLHPPMPS